MSTTHWDYAESFSGRESAYLIAGFDPSMWTIENEIRVRPVIARMKKAYYLASQTLMDELSGTGFWLDKDAGIMITVNPMKRRTPRSGELWSSEIEDILRLQYAILSGFNPRRIRILLV